MIVADNANILFRYRSTRCKWPGEDLLLAMSLYFSNTNKLDEERKRKIIVKRNTRHWLTHGINERLAVDPQTTENNLPYHVSSRSVCPREWYRINDLSVISTPLNDLAEIHRHSLVFREESLRTFSGHSRSPSGDQPPIDGGGECYEKSEKATDGLHAWFLEQSIHRPPHLVNGKWRGGREPVADDGAGDASKVGYLSTCVCSMNYS